MSRNASGVYTLPGAVNPVVTNTQITVTWANTTLQDLATAMTDSLDRQGRGSMLAALKLVDGTVGAPGLSFGSETSSGLYRAAANVVVMSVAGAELMRFHGSRVGVGVSGLPDSKFQVKFDGATVNGLRVDDTAVGGTPFLIDARKNGSQLFYVDYNGKCAAIEFGATKLAGGTVIAGSNGTDADVILSLTAPGAVTKFVSLRSFSAIPLYLGASDTNRWMIDTAGHFLPLSDNAVQVGSAGNRMSAVYAVSFVGALTGNVTGTVSGSAGSTVASLTIGTGLTASGSFNGSVARTVSIASNSNGFGVRTVSTSGPSGTPAAGDIWIQREA